MLTFIKAQASSFTASVADYFITWLCVSVFGAWYLAGSIIGTLAGGTVNFLIGRNWVFSARQKDVKRQIVKYVTVWCGNLLIVTTGVYLLTHFLGINYMLSKIIVSGLFGTIYNYLMQKKFIFI